MNTLGNGQTLIVSDPDLRLVVCWHGGSTFNVHTWSGPNELTFKPTDAFTRYSEDKSGEGEPPEPEEAVRFASEWLQMQHDEA